MQIEAVILYCSIDKFFLRKCVENLISIGIKCNIMSCTNLYMGQPEDDEELNRVNELYKDHRYYEHHKMQWYPGETPLFWEAKGRHWAIHNMVSKKCKRILLIDTDELVNPNDLSKWLSKRKYKKYNAVKLRVHTYSHHPTYQSINMVAFNTFIVKASYARSLPFRVEARLYYWNNKNRLSRWAAKAGINPWFYQYRGEPFVHHFTGVRTMEQKMLKFTNWSHVPDRNDWIEIITNETLDMQKMCVTNALGKFYFKIVHDQFNLAHFFTDKKLL